jgi:methionine synthase I (cobalamin-dependent)
VTDRFREALKSGILLDAAMGTRLIAQGLDLATDDPVLWNLSHPDAVDHVHASDVAAGSQAVLTNTFGANRVWLARYGLENKVGWLNRVASAVARCGGGEGTFRIGSIGPTAAEAPGAVLEQAEALEEAGVDALIFETYSAEPAEWALREVAGRVNLPLLVSLFEWPEPLAEPVRRFADLGAEAIGANCQDGMEPAVALARRLREFTDLPLIVKPAAGRSDVASARHSTFFRTATVLRELGPLLVGGCCGTTWTHLVALKYAWYNRDCEDRWEGSPT